MAEKKPGRPPGAKNKTKATDDWKKRSLPISQVSGVAFVPNYGFNVYWADLDITVLTIKEMMRNPYLVKIINQLVNLIFQDDPIIEILDKEEHNDEKVSKKVRQMFDTRECNLKEQTKKCFLSHFWYGPYVFNPVFADYRDQDGWVPLLNLRHLPSETFWVHPTGPKDGTGNNNLRIVAYGELLPGIARYSDGNIYYFQKNMFGVPTQLENVFHSTPPNDMSGDPAGMPLCYSVLSIVNKLNFCWLAQIQKVNRIGAPSLFIKVTNPMDRQDPKSGAVLNDIDYAQMILQNWGKNNSFTLLDNMTIEEFKGAESDSAIETIRELSKTLTDQWSPTDQISTEGANKIGGSDQAAVDLLINFVAGYLEHIANVFKPIVQDVLRVNGFLDYKVKLYFSRPEFKNGELELQRAQIGAELRVLTKNEVRLKLGNSPKNDDDLNKIADEWIPEVTAPLQDTNQKGNVDSGSIEEADIKDQISRPENTKNVLKMFPNEKEGATA
jgi:hypothetical protein